MRGMQCLENEETDSHCPSYLMVVFTLILVQIP
jgi:hypothetical protein